MSYLKPLGLGALVTQWVKRWPTDLAVVSSSPARDEDLFNCERAPIAHSLSLSSAHHPDMTEIVEKEVKLQVIDPSILGLRL